MLSFVLHGGEISRPGVTAMRIVPPLQELEDGHSCLGLRPEPFDRAARIRGSRRSSRTSRCRSSPRPSPSRGGHRFPCTVFRRRSRCAASLVRMVDDRGGTAAPHPVWFYAHLGPTPPPLDKLCPDLAGSPETDHRLMAAALCPGPQPCGMRLEPHQGRGPGEFRPRQSPHT